MTAHFRQQLQRSCHYHYSFCRLLLHVISPREYHPVWTSYKRVTVRRCSDIMKIELKPQVTSSSMNSGMPLPRSAVNMANLVDISPRPSGKMLSISLTDSTLLSPRRCKRDAISNLNNPSTIISADWPSRSSFVIEIFLLGWKLSLFPWAHRLRSETEMKEHITAFYLYQNSRARIHTIAESCLSVKPILLLSCNQL